MFIAVIAGIITGFIVSVPPLGPIAFALISKGFRGEFREGMAIATGSAFMDMIYAIVAFGGISLLFSFLPANLQDVFDGNSDTLQIILIYSGCLVVIIYGVKIMRTKIDFNSIKEIQTDKLQKVKDKAEELIHISKHNSSGKSNLLGLFIMGILLCLSSITLPASWFAFVGYIKSLGLIGNSLVSGLLFSSGAFAGTVLWFWLLLKLITGNKHRINNTTLGKLNVIAGYILIFIGVVLFFKASISIYRYI